MAGRGKYKTKQRELVSECLARNTGVYLTVDAVLSSIEASGERVGRTTVYRALESMVAEGAALKAAIPGGEASYRIAEEGAAGQLVCLGCGRVLPLDCGTAGEFAAHVLEHHDFEVDPARTVLYGRCGECMGSAHDC